jgi:hypothetical protein
MVNFLRAPPDLRLQKPLEDYIEFLEKMTPRSMPLIEKICDISIAFTDPVHNVRGQDALQKIFLHRFKTLPGLKYEVDDFCWARRAETAYIRWKLSYDFKPALLKKVERRKIDGIVEVGFSPTGKIGSHIEFWNDTTPFKQV